MYVNIYFRKRPLLVLINGLRFADHYMIVRGCTLVRTRMIAIGHLISHYL